MNIYEFVYVALSYLLLTSVIVLAIIIFSKTLDSAWLFLVIGFLFLYGKYVVELLENVGFLQDPKFSQFINHSFWSSWLSLIAFISLVISLFIFSLRVKRL